MRGFVFRLKPIRKRNFPDITKRISRFRDVSHRYGAVIFFTCVFALGTLAGSISAGRADSTLLSRLDFLFTTNLSERLTQPFLSAFSASFASNFLFLAFVFLCALAPWGCAFIFLAPAFKGFGTGLSAGYLFITYGFKGICFYLLVMLGGTFLFCFALIIECLQSHFLSCKIAGYVFRGALSDTPVNVYVRRFLIRSLYALIISALAAIIDMLLWIAFSGLFF